MKTKTKIIIALVVILAVIALISAIYAWFKPAPGITPNFTPAPQMKSATNIPREAIPVKQIIVLNKKEAVKKLKLPDEIANDDTKQVLATGTIPATSETGKTDIIAAFDEKTQETKIETKEEPHSFFALENVKAIGLRYGYCFGSNYLNNTEVDVYGRWDFLRVASLHAGIYAEVNSHADGKAMISVEYRW
jgi:hypothetical protein